MTSSDQLIHNLVHKPNQRCEICDCMLPRDMIKAVSEPGTGQGTLMACTFCIEENNLAEVDATYTGWKNKTARKDYKNNWDIWDDIAAADFDEDEFSTNHSRPIHHNNLIF